MDLWAVSRVESAFIALDILRIHIFACNAIFITIDLTVSLVLFINRINNFEDLEESEHANWEVEEVEHQWLGDVYILDRTAASAGCYVHLIEFQNNEKDIFQKDADCKEGEGAPHEQLYQLAA